MADKENKDADPAAAGGRKRLPAIALVACGAILGGAGVVFAVPPRTVTGPVPAGSPQLVQVQHPDLMEYVFNPRTEAGRAGASVAFYFVYEVREDREAAAFARIRSNWDRARSNVLMLLKACALGELKAENGQRILADRLVQELDATLFPDRRADKVARVTEVLWNRFLLQ